MKIGLSFKLIAGFLCVAIITLIVGVVGFIGLSQTNTSMHQCQAKGKMSQHHIIKYS
jgi:CHASE3 domain sensor protein